MFLHAMHQPSLQSLFSYCAFESSIFGVQRIRTPGGHSARTEWHGGVWRATQLRWWADRTPTIASQTVGQPLRSGCLSLPFSLSLSPSRSLCLHLFLFVPNKALSISYNSISCTVLTTASKTFYLRKLNKSLSFCFTVLNRRRAPGMAKQEGAPANRTARWGGLALSCWNT